MLAFSLPMQPAYARVKIWRHLQAVGASAVGKSALYVLPAGDNAAKAFQWVLNEARAVGGDAIILDARAIAGYADADIVALFQAQRDAEFAALAEEVRTLKTALARRAGPSAAEAAAQLARLAEKAKTIAARDFFPSGAGAKAILLIESVRAALRRDAR